MSDDLPPEEQALLDQALRVGQRRRRILIAGYLVALVALLIGIPAALYVIGRAGRGDLAAPALVAPWALAGLAMWAFGRWSRRA